MAREEPPLEPTPVIEAYTKDIDRTRLRENLHLTDEQSVLQLVALQRAWSEFRAAGERMRRRAPAGTRS